ncbi:MAG: 16S rRNA (cytosine(1402)-N(4))-methyltransferase RsmH [Victivallales bacterium]|nr:16S rRNA (cytosine(1402)-N(4))-methyltransferase RsmH [Victivallales bacterium]
MEKENNPRTRRPRYAGTHPRRFAEKYKELQPERYAGEIHKVMDRGQTPAGMHRPICVTEILAVLQPQAGETGLDATLGFGGHARELLRCLRPGGRLFATDVDPIELPRTERRLREQGYGEDELQVRKMNYAGIGKLLPEVGAGFDFVLADLGVSSMQLDNPERGFSYKNDGPLDLRLNPERGQSAAMLLRRISAPALEKILRLNADEPHAAELARALCRRRGEIATTLELTFAVREALTALLPHGDRNIAVARALPRVFQALRIAVNDEFSALEQFLRVLPQVLRPGGRVAVLTFHSGEDNRVMASFEAGMEAGIYTAVSIEAIRPAAAERYGNPRSKSARLRWALRA